MTTHAFSHFIDQLSDKEYIYNILNKIQSNNIEQIQLNGSEVRELLKNQPVPDDIQPEIQIAWGKKILMQSGQALLLKTYLQLLLQASRILI